MFTDSYEEEARPHPNPLPRGEGTANRRFLFFETRPVNSVDGWIFHTDGVGFSFSLGAYSDFICLKAVRQLAHTYFGNSCYFF